jgi:hypothetical protein
VIFIAAPATKAETVEADITLSADTTKTLVIDSDKVLNLNGFNATVSVNKGVTLTIVDTKFMEGDWNLDGTSAGTLTVAEGSEGTIKAWAQFGDYKYLAVNNGNTYSAHPFNVSVSALGVNTHSSTVTVGITVIADDVVAAMIDAGEFGLRNYSLAGTENADKEYTAHWKKFDGKNGLKVYFDMTGSLSEDVLSNDLLAKVGAYIKVNGETIDSLQTIEVKPLEVLSRLNEKVNDFTDAQRIKMSVMIQNTKNKAGEAYLGQYCEKFLPRNIYSGALTDAEKDALASITVEDWVNGTGYRSDNAAAHWFYKQAGLDIVDNFGATVFNMYYRLFNDKTKQPLTSNDEGYYESHSAILVDGYYGGTKFGGGKTFVASDFEIGDLFCAFTANKGDWYVALYQGDGKFLEVDRIGGTWACYDDKTTALDDDIATKFQCYYVLRPSQVLGDAWK